MGYFGKMRQLRPQWDLTKLTDLAEEMKAKGQEGLRIDKDKLGVKDLSFLEHFGHLKFLMIYDVKKGTAALKHLTELEELWLMKQRQFNCKPFSDLPQLKELALSYMSFSSWEGITDLVELERLTLANISKLTDVEFITQMPQLISLNIEECPDLTSIPDLSGMTSLTHLSLGELNKLECIDGAFRAPALKKLSLSIMPLIEPEQVKPVLDHPTLEYFSHSLEPYEDSPKNVQVDKILDGRFPEIVNHSSGGYIWIEPRREY
jgi:hypothetical protein